MSSRRLPENVRHCSSGGILERDLRWIRSKRGPRDIPFLVLNLILHRLHQIGRLDIERNNLAGECLDEDLHATTETEQRATDFISFRNATVRFIQFDGDGGLEKIKTFPVANISTVLKQENNNSPVGVHVSPALPEESTNGFRVTGIEARWNKGLRSGEFAVIGLPVTCMKEVKSVKGMYLANRLYSFLIWNAE